MHAYAGGPPDPVPMQPRQDGTSGEWLPLAEAAPRLGCSADTVRRRLKRGELQGRQVPMQGGHRWEIWVPLTAAAPTQPMQPSPALPGQPTQDLGPLVDLVRDLSAQNVALAGQLGHWQTRAQLAEERLRLLDAPAASEISDTPRPWWARWAWWRREP